MIAAFYVVLTLSCWAAVWPMLRDPRGRITWTAPMLVAAEVPNATFDSRGLV